MRAFEILNEMIIRTGKPIDGNTVVAFGAYIWMFNSGADQQDQDERKILKDIQEKTGIRLRSIRQKNSTSDVNFEDVENEIRDNRPDILLASIYNNQLYIRDTTSQHFPASSPLVKKVMKQLGLYKVTISRSDWEGDDDEAEFRTHELKGDIPDIVYHGTCTRYASSILRTGLRPTDNANWMDQNLKFRDKIFLTADENNAMFHANRQAEKLNCAPVVIATRIPDRNLITMDYDVATMFYGASPKTKKTGYHKEIKAAAKNQSWRTKHVKTIQKFNPKTDFTKASGIFAYKGSIRPSFFVGFISTLSEEGHLSLSNKGFEFDNIQEFKKALEMYDHHGFYDSDYQPEDDEEDNSEDD